jgi:hypothetical protein
VESLDKGIVKNVIGLNGANQGIITYAGRDGGSLYSGVSPGIGFGGTNEFFSNAGAQAHLVVPAAEDQVIDFIGSINSGANNQYVEMIIAYTAVGGGFYLRSYVQAVNPSVELGWRAADGTTVSYGKTCPVQPIDDDKIHHWRITFDHDGNAQASIDGSAAANVSVAALAGKEIPAPLCNIGDNAAGGYRFWGVMYSLTVDSGAAVLAKAYLPYNHATVTGDGEEWRFEEASGDIVGTYNAITCADNGTPVYGVVAT